MLKNKSVIVTGSTSGIGLGVARRLAGAGANIMLNGFGDAGEIEKLRAGMAKEFGVEVAYNGADLSKPDQAVQLVRAAEKTFGAADILVNNAGIQHVDLVEDFPPEKWDAVIAINLSSAFHTIRTAVPGMKSRGWGRIVNIASAHGLVASPKKTAYVAAKHGLVGLTKAVALENAKSGITCNAICPGWVLTPLVQKQVDAWAERESISLKDAEVALLSEKQPAQAFVQPEEIGAMVEYLCSDSAKLVTGTTLSIDGGWTAQ